VNTCTGSVLIRRMELEDVPTAHAIDMMSFNLPWPERSFRYEVSDNLNSRCWVTEVVVDGMPRVVGMLVLWLVLDEVHIATLAVHPEFRRRGIANRLLVESLRIAHDEGALCAMLEVRAGNIPAQEMYRKLGFDAVGRRPQYYRDNGEDAILMTLDRLTDISTPASEICRTSKTKDDA